MHLSFRDALAQLGLGIKDSRALHASTDGREGDRVDAVAAVKDALHLGVRAYLRRASSGGMPSKDLAAVEAAVSGVMELGYLEAALQERATEVAASLSQSACDDAYRALRSCGAIEADGSRSMHFDEALVHDALYGLAVIRARINDATGKEQTAGDAT